MFKRQFYAVDHADNDDASSSDSSVNTNSDDDSAHDQDEDASSPEEATPGSNDSDSEGGGEPPESESEDNEWNTFRDRNVKVVQPIDSSHFLLKKPTTTKAANDESGEDEAITESGGDRVVLRVGGVLKCRYCVKILCLSDESMKAHLLSKRHARSLKKLASGKLKVQLDSDGKEEEEGETHAERLERIRSIAEQKVVPVKRKAKSGRRRQRKRAKQKIFFLAVRKIKADLPCCPGSLELSDGGIVMKAIIQSRAKLNEQCKRVRSKKVDDEK